MRWSFALVALAGCSAIYGLDGVKNDDPDDDHIPSSIDNCPTVYNPDQSDINGDMIGDACQVCGATDPTDSDGDGIPDQCDGCDNRLPDNNGNGIPDACEHPHDEDGDGVPDTHDNCPSVANPDQADTMDMVGPVADGVGDACDDSPSLDRQLFDSFATDNQLWVVQGAWMIQGDQAIAPLTGAEVVRYAGFAHGTFRISTRVSLPASGAVSIVLVDGKPPGQQTKVACTISPSTHQVSLQIGSAATVGGYVGSGSADDLILEETSTGGANLSLFSCITGSKSFVTGSTTADIPSWMPGLAAQGAVNTTSGQGQVTFDYFDVVTSGL